MRTSDEFSCCLNFKDEEQLCMPALSCRRCGANVSFSLQSTETNADDGTIVEMTFRCGECDALHELAVILNRFLFIAWNIPSSIREG